MKVEGSGCGRRVGEDALISLGGYFVLEANLEEKYHVLSWAHLEKNRQDYGDLYNQIASIISLQWGHTIIYGCGLVGGMWDSSGGLCEGTELGCGDGVEGRMDVYSNHSMGGGECWCLWERDGTS
ncbi:hypothetical protein Tco_1156106 [Tanacetum coccineum]